MSSAADPIPREPGQPDAVPPAGRPGRPQRVTGSRQQVGGGQGTVIGPVPLYERSVPVLQRLAQRRPARAPRTPFVLLVLGLLGGGLVGLLLLNSASAADSFSQQRLQEDTAALQLRQEQLAREVTTLDAPGSLAAAAARLGLVPAGQAGFLVLKPDGSAAVVGTPAPATSPPPPPPPPRPAHTQPGAAGRSARSGPRARRPASTARGAQPQQTPGPRR